MEIALCLPKGLLLIFVIIILKGIEQNQLNLGVKRKYEIHLCIGEGGLLPSQSIEKQTDKMQSKKPLILSPPLLESGRTNTCQ